MDKNSTIGIVIISAILLAYFTFFAPTAPPPPAQKEVVKTQLDTLKKALINDSISLKNKEVALGTLASSLSGENKELVIENKDIKVVFNSKGGKIKSVLLKNYVTSGKKPLYLIDEQTSVFDVVLPAKTGPLALSDLYFSTLDQNKTLSGNDSANIVYTVKTNEGQVIEQKYSLKSEGYLIGYQVRVDGMETFLKNENVLFNWNAYPKLTEADLTQSRVGTGLNYRLNDGTIGGIDEKKIESTTEVIENVNWISFKTNKFFLSSFIARNNNIKKSLINTSANEADSIVVKSLSSSAEVPVADIVSGKGNFSFYFGPNKYTELQKVSEAGIATAFEDNVYLGWVIIGAINKWLVLPAFMFIKSMVSNFGLIIILLVLFIRSLLLPLSYRSHLSMAKIKVLKPEMDEIKARVGDDMTAQQQETMKLYQSVGVNPLAGCVPVLLSMPFLFAMLYLLPNLIELRQEPFLWATDLSTYDSVASLPFNIPFYGDHVSLFTILMTASTILYTWYNSQMASTMQGPMMYMQYFMPLIFMFVLNSFPAGLSYYYLVGNMVAIGQQFVIKQFVDETKIREKLEEYKKNAGTKKKSRWQQRLEDAMKMQEDAKKAPVKKKK